MGFNNGPQIQTQGQDKRWFFYMKTTLLGFFLFFLVFNLFSYMSTNMMSVAWNEFSYNI